MRPLRMLKVLFLVSAMLSTCVSFAQDLDRVERDAAQTMLKDVSNDVSKRYFDSTLRGVDWASLVKKTQENIDKSHDLEEAIAQIASLLQSLDDSHTFFIPPPRANTVVYGWKFKIIGSQTYINEVSAGSDAERQGVHPGDEVLAINGFRVDRQSAPLLHSAMERYLPLSSVDVRLRDRQGHQRQLRLLTSVIEKPAVAGMSAWAPYEARIKAENAWENTRAEPVELSPDVMAIRIPVFFQTGHEVDAVFAKARRYKKMIIDLRGCPGGRVTSVHGSSRTSSVTM